MQRCFQSSNSAAGLHFIAFQFYRSVQHIAVLELASFMKKLQELLEDDYEDFEFLKNVEKSSYVLGSELWESKFDGLLALVKEIL